MNKPYLGELRFILLILILNSLLIRQAVKALTDNDTNLFIYELQHFDRGSCSDIISSFDQIQMFYGDISNKLYILGEVTTNGGESYTMVKSDVTKLYDSEFLANGWTIDDKNNLLYLAPFSKESAGQFAITTINLKENIVVKSFQYPNVKFSSFVLLGMALDEDGNLFFRQPFNSGEDFRI